jgi:hypothetical protein
MNKNPLQKKEKRHRLTEAITVALIVTVALSVITSAAVFAQTKEDTIASIQVAPKTVKMNESIVITAWVSPVPPYKQPGNLPGEYVGYTFTITKPNGDTENVGPVNSKGDGTYTFNTYAISWANGVQKCHSQEMKHTKSALLKTCIGQ